MLIKFLLTFICIGSVAEAGLDLGRALFLENFSNDANNIQKIVVNKDKVRKTKVVTDQNLQFIPILGMNIPVANGMPTGSIEQMFNQATGLAVKSASVPSTDNSQSMGHEGDNLMVQDYNGQMPNQDYNSYYDSQGAPNYVVGPPGPQSQGQSQVQSLGQGHGGQDYMMQPNSNYPYSTGYNQGTNGSPVYGNQYNGADYYEYGPMPDETIGPKAGNQGWSGNYQAHQPITNDRAFVRGQARQDYRLPSDKFVYSNEPGKSNSRRTQPSRRPFKGGASRPYRQVGTKYQPAMAINS